jgi:hypothetical protein
MLSSPPPISYHCKYENSNIQKKNQKYLKRGFTVYSYISTQLRKKHNIKNFTHSLKYKFTNRIEFPIEIR